MATIELKVTLTLDEKDCAAIKKFLGKQSQTTYENAGLTQEEACALSEVWSLIPYGDEE